VKKKLAVCYPGDMPTFYAKAVDSLLNIERPEGFEVQWFRGFGWCQARRRIVAAEAAIAWGADLIASLDMDQVYEPDILNRLVGRIEEGFDCVSALIPSRGKSPALDRPFQGMGWRMDGDKFTPVTAEDGEMVPAAFGTHGCCIFRASDIERLQQPWYAYTYDKKNWQEIEGEDSRFFLRFNQELGVKTWIDTTIKVKHCHVFQIDETYSERFNDWVPGPLGSGY
jgi:hypothetical protein